MRRTRSGTIIGLASRPVGRTLSYEQNLGGDERNSRNIFGRRTRSGTIIGPPSKMPQTVLQKISLLDEVSDDEVLLRPGKGGILDDDWIMCGSGDETVIRECESEDELNPIDGEE
jgi:hypothetical protein